MTNIFNRRNSIILLVMASILLAAGLRAYVAFRSEQAINVDERFYLSAAATGSTGAGYYPFVMGFDPIPIYPGNGYAILLYVFGYDVFGPSVLSLRLVSYGLGLLALPAIYLLLRRLYDPPTALLGLALFPWTYFFVLSNSIRMDAITIAYGSWALLFACIAVQERLRGRWQVLVGLFLGLGLQVHLNTIVIAFAIGLLYLYEHVRTARLTGRWLDVRAPMLAYVLGYGVGVAVFVVFNILPDPDAFTTTLEKIRLWDNELNYTGLDDSERNRSVLRTLIEPGILLARERVRFETLLLDAPPIESLLTVLGIVGLFTRFTLNDRRLALMVFGAAFAGAIIFINESYFYLIHLLPIFFLPIPALIIYGFRKVKAQPPPLHIAALLVAAIAGGSFFTFTQAVGLRKFDTPEEPIYVDHVQRLAATTDVIAGEGIDYVPYFADYPYYIGLGGVEQVLGLLLFDMEDFSDYWSYKQPDYVFGFIPQDLQDHFIDADYINVAPAVWASPDLWYTEPDFDNPLGVFNDEVAVMGAAVSTETVAVCGRLGVHLWWQTLAAEVSSDYSAGLYLVNADDQIVVQADGPPANRVLGTWAQLEFNSDVRFLSVPCDLPEGTYMVTLALYHYATLEHLPLMDTPDDALTLARVTVENP